MRKTKWKMLAVAFATVLIIVISQGTLAYYTTIGKATNVVTSGNIQLKIHEETVGGAEFPEEGIVVIPGDVIIKKVTIENDCEHPFYVRVKLESRISNGQLSVEDCLKPYLNEADWVSRDDGYVYYTKVVQPREVTTAVFEQVEIVGSKVDQTYIGEALILDVTAQAVQSKNNEAENPWDAQGWPAGSEE